MNTNNIYKLQDGRKIGFTDYGPPQGFPIFGFHGTPGSRLWLSEENETLRSLQIRLVTVDRPGYGLSNAKPGRTILDFADDVAALADFLNFREFAVMGISGGGVYAAACAFSYPERISRAGLISTIHEFENGRLPKNMSIANRMAFFLARRVPWLLRYIFGRQKKLMERHPDRYKASVQSNVAHLCKADQEVMSRDQVAEEMLIHMKEAFRSGPKEAVSECRLLTGKWGFNCSEITVPVEIWHGTEDTLAPVQGAQQLAAIIPNCRAHFVEGKGHFLTEDDKIWGDILASLVEN